MPLLLILTLAAVPLRMSGVRVREVNWHLFLMGAAFLLIESKAVTTLAVIFGSHGCKFDRNWLDSDNDSFCKSLVSRAPIWVSVSVCRAPCCADFQFSIFI